MPVAATALRHVVGIDAVNRRLIEMFENARPIGGDVGGVHLQLVMPRAEGSGHLSRQPGLGRRIVDTDREGLQVRGARRRRRRDERAGVDAAGQEHADGHVGHQVRADALAHGVSDGGAKLAFGLRRSRRRPVRLARIREHAALARSIVPAPPRAGVERLDALLPGERRNDAAPRKKSEHAGGRRRAVDEPGGAKRGEFRRKRQSIAGRRDVQRLDPEAVAREHERAFGRVPPPEREHAAHARERRRAVAREQPQEHFGVAGRREPFAARLQFEPEVAVVVDLAVEDQMMPAVRRGHRLRAVRTEVDDRQPPMHQQDVVGVRGPEPLAVGPAMGERVGEAAGDDRSIGDRPTCRHDAGDAAHQKILLGILIVSFG